MASTSPSSRTPWTLDQVRAIIPAGLAHLSSQLRQCDPADMDRGTLVCATMFGSGELAGQAAWLKAVRKTSPVTADDFDNEDEIYRPPMFTVVRVPAGDRDEFGEFAYTSQKDDEPQVWSLVADRAFIQVGYTQGSVSQDELWSIARRIIEDS
ncbi:hypothetical protein [Gordonia liuliyuniae]|uniref:Uncharacterized protein n=1 Tax=Gordonia liuliyuniae TaxID=2911517 RepID=A0ABS9IYD6_9ACTN|nr:hypothetical protein [Gordonia liuliyuniae]MCF8590579.1 hypothetical protein [Gordonia liuliyuniae]